LSLAKRKDDKLKEYKKKNKKLEKALLAIE